VNGTRRLFDFEDDNPLVEFHPCDRTNDTALIRRNDRVMALNSAIPIDLSGQVCADFIGCRISSGIGGQMDLTSLYGQPLFQSWALRERELRHLCRDVGSKICALGQYDSVQSVVVPYEGAITCMDFSGSILFPGEFLSDALTSPATGLEVLASQVLGYRFPDDLGWLCWPLRTPELGPILLQCGPRVVVQFLDRLIRRGGVLLEHGSLFVVDSRTSRSKRTTGDISTPIVPDPG
jgi:hypothetical protein